MRKGRFQGEGEGEGHKKRSRLTESKEIQHKSQLLPRVKDRTGFAKDMREFSGAINATIPSHQTEHF